jgi:hypothetical protein
MESKLPIYQLAAPCHTCSGMGYGVSYNRPPMLMPGNSSNSNNQIGPALPPNFTPTTPTTRKKVTADTVVNYLEKGLQIAGGVANVINMFNNKTPIYINGQPATTEQMQELKNYALAKEQGRAEEYAQNYANRVQSNDDAFQKFLEYQRAMGDNTPKKDNTALYIGLGLGGVAVLALLFMVMNKK